MFICGGWPAEKLKVLRLLPGRNFDFAALVTKMFFHLNLIVGTDIQSLCQANFSGLKMMAHYLTFLSKISLTQQSVHFANESQQLKRSNGIAVAGLVLSHTSSISSN
ncbi:hypothetical protein DP200_04800 [Enterobacter hormaechei subsp. oharae]|nr:hypothetical protein DP200_04800 [Enterobacter hormaechei subsp. oharae]